MIDVLEEAMTWLGTPYHLNARLKGVGVDCGQFILACFINTHRIPEVTLEHLKPDFHLHKGREIYLEHLEKHCRRLAADEAPQPADIAVFQAGRIVAHGALVVNWPEVIHIPYGERVMIDHAEREPLKSKLRGFYRLEV